MIDIFAQRVEIPSNISIEELEQRIALIDNTLQLYKFALNQRLFGKNFTQRVIYPHEFLQFKNELKDGMVIQVSKIELPKNIEPPIKIRKVSKAKYGYGKLPDVVSCVLKRFPNGLRVAEIAKELSTNPGSVASSLRKNPDRFTQIPERKWINKCTTS